ncbi:hypothetical protein COCC4DRAFT_56339 [Bipolaris maydis ATCC 48331]|uniref:Uncharacterized protein n=1 Tax=Cochliobolus heterostrophus (strain C4 / ATCC 48331 / race T) TaxID=665024 RepID=N4XEG0_COCH4|nr:uncharacterized protein COCC4DRAFT_56339 [Bipolaris maydis ATCC 48331]ENI10100.1 hypothetical protein COCC4DRAFT_56339 [Bipolaris maydis ATCC 48331]
MYVYKHSMTYILPQKRRIPSPLSDSCGSRLQHAGASWQHTKFTANQTHRRNVTIHLSYDHSCNIPHNTAEKERLLTILAHNLHNHMLFLPLPPISTHFPSDHLQLPPKAKDKKKGN